MVKRGNHYELAFEEYLRSRQVPYLAVDESRRSLLPVDDSARTVTPAVSQTDRRLWGVAVALME